jgi:hypothetical protein
MKKKCMVLMLGEIFIGDDYVYVVATGSYEE